MAQGELCSVTQIGMVMNFYYIETMPDRPLDFDDHFEDPYEQRQPSYDEVRQDEIDALDVTIRDIGQAEMDDIEAIMSILISREIILDDLGIRGIGGLTVDNGQESSNG